MNLSVPMTGTIYGPIELRETTRGVPVANFTLKSGQATYDLKSGSWRSTKPMFLRCTVWGGLAVNLYETVGEGSRIVARGVLKVHEVPDGADRMDLEVEDVGPSLRRHTAILQPVIYVSDVT